MTETSASRTPIPEDLFWVTYLREDIQDLRQDVRSEVQEVRQEIQGVRQNVHELRQEVRQDMYDLRQDMRQMNQRVDGFHTHLHQHLDDLGRRLDSRFTWMMTTLLGIGGLVVAAAGVVVALLRP